LRALASFQQICPVLRGFAADPQRRNFAYGRVDRLRVERVAKEETIVSGMAGRYAQALHALAVETGAARDVGESLSTFQQMIDESADLQRLVRSPVFSAEEQTKALTSLLDKAGIGGVAANFIKLVAAKRRLFAISDMIAGYRALDDAANGVTRAFVTVAEPMSEAQTEALRQQLVAVTGGKSVDVDVTVDPAIIGGLVAKIGSRMVDSSLKTKLNSIRTRMKEVG
jgi:F-type H+-transporting ATPase subunit delta